MFSTMYKTNYLKKLCFILIITFYTFDGQSMKVDLKNSSICGLPKKQIQMTLSHLKKSVTGIAINATCLEEQNSSNNKCIAEQHKLIECLRKEYILAEQLINEVNEGSNLPYIQNIKKQYHQNIVEIIEKLDNVHRDYEETVIEHLKSIDEVIKKRICVDDLHAALTNAKIELIAEIYQQVLDNINQICQFGINNTECINLMHFTHRNIN